MKSGKFRFSTSTVVVDELSNAPDQVRKLFFDTFTGEGVIDVNAEMEKLASEYLKHAILTPRYTDDARHVAVCTVARADSLVSWNFKHLVNVNREKGFNAVNLLQGYQTVRIVNPLELIYGAGTEEL